MLLAVYQVYLCLLSGTAWIHYLFLFGQLKLKVELISQFSSVQSLSRVRLFATPWITARQASLSITNSRCSLRLMSIESVMPSSHLILCRPFSSCPQSLPASESFPMSQLFARGGQSTGVSEELIINSWFLGKIKKFARERGLWSVKWTQQWPDQNIQMIIRILWELLGSTAPLSWTGGIFLIFSTESEGLASESAFTLLTPEAYFGNGGR